MDLLNLVTTLTSVAAVFACVYLLARTRRHAEAAEVAAEDADGDAQTCLGCHGGLRAEAEELRKEFQQLIAKYAEAADGAKASAADADFSRQGAESWFSATRDQADTAASMAEVVKVEVAKIETLIARLNKERQDNPPFVAITYGETGEPAGVTLSPDFVAAAEIESRASVVTGEKTCYPGSPFPCCQKAFQWGDTTLPGTPFQFSPVQVHPTVVDDNEADATPNPATFEELA